MSSAGLRDSDFLLFFDLGALDRPVALDTALELFYEPGLDTGTSSSGTGCAPKAGFFSSSSEDSIDSESDKLS